MADRNRTLVLDAEVGGRSFSFENETLTMASEEEPKVITAYFAEKKIEYKEETHDDTFSFKFEDNNNVLDTQAKKVKLANYIRGKLSFDGDNKYTNNQKVLEALTEAAYVTNDEITIVALKKEKKEYYSKITIAPMGYEVYLVAETKKLDGKTLKIKILEGKSQNQEKTKVLKLVKTETDKLPVLVFAQLEDKTTTTEAGDWIAIDITKQDGKIINKTEGIDIELGIKKIQLRPKEDKMASKTEDAIKSFEGWQEALYLREDETVAGKKVIKDAKDDKTARDAETFMTLTRDADADKKENKKSFPKKIGGPKTVEIGKEAIYSITTYNTSATKADKKNIRWSIWVTGDKKTEYKIIDAKSKAGLYTYAKMELDGDINKLTLFFDKALKGKKVQIEPFRGTPDINNAKDYVRTTTVKEPATPKIAIRDKAHLYLKIKGDDIESEEEERANSVLKSAVFKLASSTTVYIYPDGKITNTYLEKGDKMRYVYVDTSKEEHDLGSFKLIEAQKWLDATRHQSKTNNVDWKKVISGGKTRYYKKDGNKKTLLMTPFSGSPNKAFKYNKGPIDFALYESTDREHFNPKAFATVIGAMIEVNFTDIVSNGSVDTDGTGAFSVSHFNGFNMDFKFLRKDKKKAKIDKYKNGNLVEVIYSNNKKVDIDRQNQFLDALFKFGWGINKKNYANITHENKNLNHCDPDEHHWNHLHLQGFKVKYK